jgi:hypothetical protein
MGLKTGEEIVMIEKAGVIHLVPQKSIKQMRGFVKGGNTKNIREERGPILILIDLYGWLDYFLIDPSQRNTPKAVEEANEKDYVTPHHRRI